MMTRMKKKNNLSQSPENLITKMRDLKTMIKKMIKTLIGVMVMKIMRKTMKKIQLLLIKLTQKRINPKSKLILMI